MTIYIVSRDTYTKDDGEYCGKINVVVTTNKAQADACYDRLMNGPYWRDVYYEEYEDGEEFED